MADRPPHQLQVVGPRYDPRLQPAKGPSAAKVISVLILFPVGSGLLALSGITLAATLFGLAISTPLFIFFSPIIVPATVIVSLAVMAFLAAEAFSLTGITSLSWTMRYLQEAARGMPESLEQAKKRMQEMAGVVGQKTREMGHDIQKKAVGEGK